MEGSICVTRNSPCTHKQRWIRHGSPWPWTNNWPANNWPHQVTYEAVASQLPIPQVVWAIDTYTIWMNVVLQLQASPSFNWTSIWLSSPNILCCYHHQTRLGSAHILICYRSRVHWATRSGSCAYWQRLIRSSVWMWFWRSAQFVLIRSCHR